MTASKGKNDRRREDDPSILEEIKEDNVEAAKKQQSKKRIDLTTPTEDYQSTANGNSFTFAK
jgi:hypothetical protein